MEVNKGTKSKSVKMFVCKIKKGIDLLQAHEYIGNCLKKLRT